MTDAISVAGSAIYLALDGAVGAAVYQHVPENTPLPVVIIGDIDNVAPIAAPGDPDRRMSITIVVLTEGEERQPCAAILGAVVQLLDGVQLKGVAGWSVAPQLDGSSCSLAEDGAGYIGLAQLTVFALAD